MEKYLVEFIGTFALLLTIVLSRGNPIAIGGILGLAVLGGGKISGGHFNPAVTTAMYVTKKMKKNDLVPYIVAQLSGGTMAVVLSNTIKKML
jgi:aquaporin Z